MKLIRIWLSYANKMDLRKSSQGNVNIDNNKIENATLVGTFKGPSGPSNPLWLQ